MESSKKSTNKNSFLSLDDLRSNLNLKPSPISSSIRYFRKQVIDWDVYLPTKKKNLQRPLVWDLHQKAELINSILKGRHIPDCAILVQSDDVWQVIDGKQRLSTICGFIDGLFPLALEGRLNGDLVYFSELPADYKLVIQGYMFRYFVVNEPKAGLITDDDKIAWFKFINYAGTPQDKEHFNSLL